MPKPDQLISFYFSVLRSIKSDGYSHEYHYIRLHVTITPREGPKRGEARSNETEAIIG